MLRAFWPRHGLAQYAVSFCFGSFSSGCYRSSECEGWSQFDSWGAFPSIFCVFFIVHCPCLFSYRVFNLSLFVFLSFWFLCSLRFLKLLFGCSLVCFVFGSLWFVFYRSYCFLLWPCRAVSSLLLFYFFVVLFFISVLFYAGLIIWVVFY
jgi:hypothetical protein